MVKFVMPVITTATVITVLVSFGCSRQQNQSKSGSDTTGTSVILDSSIDSVVRTKVDVTTWNEVSELKVIGNLVKIGKAADDIYSFLTPSYRCQEPTILKGADGLNVTQHFLVEGKYIDITFERPGNRYIVTSIRVRKE